MKVAAVVFAGHDGGDDYHDDDEYQMWYFVNLGMASSVHGTLLVTMMP